MRIGLTSLLLVVALIGPSADAASESALSAFHTPGWTVACVVVGGEESTPTLSCQSDQGRVVSMSPRGAAISSVAVGGSYRDPFAAHRLLRARRYWRFGNLYGCFNRGDGLHCRNESGDGWWLFRS